MIFESKMQPNDIWEQSEDDLSLAPNKLYLTCSEAAKLLNVTTKTIRRWDNQGKINAIRTEGGHRRISRSDILKMQMISKNIANYSSDQNIKSAPDLKIALSKHELKSIKNQLKIIQFLIEDRPQFHTAIITIQKFISFLFKFISQFKELKPIKNSCINLLNKFNGLKHNFENKNMELSISEGIHEPSISGSPRTSFNESRNYASYVFEKLIKASVDNSIPIEERKIAKTVINKIIEPYKELTSYLSAYEPGTVEHDVCKLLLTKHPLDFDIKRSNWSVRTLSKACKTLKTKNCSKSQVGRVYKKIGWSKRINYRLLSPDKEWGSKMKHIASIMSNLEKDDVLLYGDEFKFTSTKIKEYNISKTAPKGLNFRLRESPVQYFGPTVGFELTGVYNPKNKQLELEKLSESTFEGYLIGLKKVLDRIKIKYKGKIKLIIDNGPIHGSHRLEKRINEIVTRDIEIIYLPTYSPNQNPIERVWRTLLFSVPREANTINELDAHLKVSVKEFKRTKKNDIENDLNLHCPICSIKFSFNPLNNENMVRKVEQHTCFNIPYLNPYIIQILINNLDKGEY